MAPILFPVGIAVAAVLVALLTVKNNKRHGRPSPHQTTIKATTPTIKDALKLARQIEPPVATLMKGGEYEHGEFWGDHDSVIQSAWKEWWEQERSRLPDLQAATGNNDDNPSLLNPELTAAVRKVRQDPTKANELNLKELFALVQPGVHQIQWFTPHGVRQLRQHLDASSYYYNTRSDTNNNDTNTNGATTQITKTATAETAQIPHRRPNGMNRYGIIIDPTIEGAVSYDGLNLYIQNLVDDMIRPLGRMLFPEVTSRNHPEDDSESYAFTICYKPDKDMELKEHSDGSIYTININLNLIEGDEEDDDDQKEEEEEEENKVEGYKGSTLYFVPPDDDNLATTTTTTTSDDNDAPTPPESKQQQPRNNITFTPGMAVLHRGNVRHGSYPITTGERHNLVIWLFGQYGYVRFGSYPKKEQLIVQERWGGKH